MYYNLMRPSHPLYNTWQEARHLLIYGSRAQARIKLAHLLRALRSNGPEGWDIARETIGYVKWLGYPVMSWHIGDQA